LEIQIPEKSIGNSGRFYEPGFTDAAWDNIVPGNWQLQENTTLSIYNIQHPFEADPPRVPHV
jgi:beta-galactosidase/beta-glucuronidase